MNERERIHIRLGECIEFPMTVEKLFETINSVTKKPWSTPACPKYLVDIEQGHLKVYTVEESEE
jgi:hypothetical protein